MDKAVPGATFKHSGYRTSHFRIVGPGESVPAGTLTEMNSMRPMGTAAEMAKYLQPGQVTFDEKPATDHPSYPKVQPRPALAPIRFVLLRLPSRSSTRVSP